MGETLQCYANFQIVPMTIHKLMKAFTATEVPEMLWISITGHREPTRLVFWGLNKKFLKKLKRTFELIKIISFEKAMIKICLTQQKSWERSNFYWNFVQTVETENCQFILFQAQKIYFSCVNKLLYCIYYEDTRVALGGLVADQQ